MTVRRSLPVFLSLLVSLFVATSAHAVSTTVVISQFQVAGASAADEFVELHNVSASPVDLNGWRLVYRSAAGTTDVAIANWTVSTIIPAGGYYLIAHAVSYDGAATADITYNTGATGAFSGTAGGLALRNGALNTGTVIDSVGFGTATNAFVEGTAEPVPAANSSAARQTNGCQDTDNNATDFVVVNPSAPRNSATTLAPCGGGPITPTLNINDVTAAEGNAATTNFTFSVSLSSPAGPGGVTFDIATANNTAVAPGDYIADSLTGQAIPSGSSGPYIFVVTVNGDTASEANETFFVNVTNIVGATAGDAQGLGTIQNDDVTATFIHDVQGPGGLSPIEGATVTIDGIVTGVKSNGFFVQEEDAQADADSATSEGIFVFTSSAPPAAAAFAARVQVTGTVAEFVPSSDPQQPPVTELTSPTVVQISTGNPLPTPVPLTTSFPDPAGPFDQLERVEGMRVSAASMTATAPSDGTLNETNNTGTSNGRFFAVVTGTPRPLREPGIRQPDVPPVGTIPPIPRWDTNPELLGIESATLTGQPILTVKSSDMLSPVVGPLDYGFRRYAIYPDGTNTITVTPGTLPTTVTTPTAQEFTVASWNIFHFYDGTAPQAVSPATYTARLNKASIAIRNHLKFPDVIGLQEVENLTVLQDLATKINNDAVANAQPDPQYVAYLSEGNDQGGIDVGFLVKTAQVSAGLPRVTVNSVTQIGLSTMWTDPADGVSKLLNDRPSLVLDAVINRAPGVSFPIVVINNHLRSLIGIDSAAADGATTEGDRVRRKRQTQADFLAQYIQGRLTSNAAEHIVLVGDFNAFEFNDGYVDVINTLAGTPPPDSQTVVCSTCPTAPNTNDGIDQVNPDLTNLVDTPPPDERYSYIHDGNAQNLDHVIVSAAMVADTTARRIEHARLGTDYPLIARSNSGDAIGISDHDPVVGFFAANALSAADLSITKIDNVDPVNAGQNFFYTITVTNAGPDVVDNVSWSDTLPAGTTFVSLSQPGGWSCTTPAVGANGTVTCSIASLGVSSAAFNLTVAVNAGLPSGTVLSNTATVTSTTADPNTGNESATATTTVTTSADLVLSKTDTPDPVTAGSNLSYQVTLTNNGPSNASATFTDTLPAGTTFVSLSTTGTWSCTTPAVGATGTINCTNAGFLVTVDFFTIVVNVDANVAAGTVLSNTASLSSTTSDPNPANNSDTATTTVTASSDMSITKTDSPDPVTPGSNITYTINVQNFGPSDASGVVVTDAVPAFTTFVSLTPFADFDCTTPAVGATGTITCTKPTPFLAGLSGNLVLVVMADPSAPTGTPISNTATVTSSTNDANAANNSSTVETTVGAGSADLSITKSDAPDPVTAGTNLTYTVVVSNAGPTFATFPSWSDTLPAGTTFVSVTPTPGWDCVTPAVGATGTVTCSIETFGIATATFTLVVAVDPALSAGSTIINTATVTATTADPNNANNSATATTTVGTASADVSITKTDSPDPVTPGTTLTYSISVANAGPASATTVAWSDTLPVGTTFVSLTAPAGWTCTTPAPGATGTVNCSIESLGLTTAAFTLAVAVDPGLTAGTTIANTATVTSATTDPNPANNSATASTIVDAGSADLSVIKTDSPDPVLAGGNLTYTITVDNAGPTNAASAVLTDTLPSNTTFVSLTAPAGWTCTTPAVGATGTVTCNAATVPAGSAAFTLVVRVATVVTPGSTITNTATISSATPDANTANDSATTATVVTSPASVSGTKTVAGTFTPGGAVSYTITLTNNGTSTQQDNAGNEFVDVLPSSLTLVSASATSGTAVATVGTNTVTWNGSIAAGASVTITVNATISASATPGTSVSNQGSINFDANGDGTNESTAQTDSPAAAGAADPTIFVVGAAAAADIPLLDESALLALATLLAAAAAFALRR